MKLLRSLVVGGLVAGGLLIAAPAMASTPDFVPGLCSGPAATYVGNIVSFPNEVHLTVTGCRQPVSDLQGDGAARDAGSFTVYRIKAATCDVTQPLSTTNCTPQQGVADFQLPPGTYNQKVFVLPKPCGKYQWDVYDHEYQNVVTASGNIGFIVGGKAENNDGTCVTPMPTPSTSTTPPPNPCVCLEPLPPGQVRHCGAIGEGCITPTPTPSQTVTPVPSTTPPVTPTLPYTGAATLTLSILGSVLIAIGSGLYLGTRRRSH